MYFQRYQLEIASEILGSFETPFWTKIVMQASHEEPFVAETIVALSAFMTSRKLSRSKVNNALAARHATFALERYQKALEHMRTSLSKKGYPRKALIGCLMVCCFQALSGNWLAAKAHAHGGQRLLNEWLTAQSHRGVYTGGFTSPASHIIEDDLIQAAFLLDTQITG
jgi:hypothetical protein